MEAATMTVRKGANSIPSHSASAHSDGLDISKQSRSFAANKSVVSRDVAIRLDFPAQIDPVVKQQARRWLVTQIAKRAVEILNEHQEHGSDHQQ